MVTTRHGSGWMKVVLRTGLCFAAAGVIVSASVPSARAEAPPETYQEKLRKQAEEWRRQEAAEEALKVEWQKKQTERRAAVEKARAMVEEARSSRARAGDGMHGGVKRSEWTKRWKEAQEDLTDAEAELDALPGEARRAGVPPGWLRD